MDKINRQKVIREWAQYGLNTPEIEDENVTFGCLIASCNKLINFLFEEIKDNF